MNRRDFFKKSVLGLFAVGFHDKLLAKQGPKIGGIDLPAKKTASGNKLLAPEQVTKEALKSLNEKLGGSCATGTAYSDYKAREQHKKAVNV